MEIGWIVSQNLLERQINPTCPVISREPLSKCSIPTTHGAMTKVGPYPINGNAFGVGHVGSRGGSKGPMPVCDLFFKSMGPEHSGQCTRANITVSVHLDDDLFVVMEPKQDFLFKILYPPLDGISVSPLGGSLKLSRRELGWSRGDWKGPLLLVWLLLGWLLLGWLLLGLSLLPLPPFGFGRPLDPLCFGLKEGPVLGEDSVLASSTPAR